MIVLALMLTVGAIRWDAWHGDRSEVGKAVERSLGPEKWHGRLPFFARELPGRGVRIDGASQAVVDKEIALARQARLDYWAFVLYDESSAMSLPLKFYLDSRRKRGLRFCVIVESPRLQTPESADRVAALLVRPEYLRVDRGRPLLYVLTNGKSPGALDRVRTLVRGRLGAIRMW